MWTHLARVVALLTPVASLAAEPIVVPDFSFDSNESFALSVMLHAEVVDRLLADGHIVLSQQVVSREVGEAAIDRCLENTACPQDVLPRIPAQVALLGRVSRQAGSLVGHVELWEQSRPTAVDVRDIPIRPGQEGAFTDEVARATRELIGRLPPSSTETLMAAARMIAGQPAGSFAKAPAPAPAPAFPVPASTWPAPAPAPGPLQPNPTGAIQPYVPAPAYGGQPAPAYGGTPAPAYGGQPAPAYGGTPAPAYGGQPAPAYGGTPAPAYGGTPAPAYGGTPAPAYGGTPAPAYGGTPAPAYGGAPAPAYGGQPAPAYGPAPVVPAPAPVVVPTGIQAPPEPAFVDLDETGRKKPARDAKVTDHRGPTPARAGGGAVDYGQTDLRAALEGTGLRYRHVAGAEQSLRNSGMDPRDWLYKAAPHGGRLVVEPQFGMGLGDTDRQADVRIHLVDGEQVDGWYQEGPVVARRPRGGLFVGYAPVAYFDFGALVGMQYGKRYFTTGYHLTEGVQETDEASDLLSVAAVQFVIQPRARAYVVPTGPAKPFLFVGGDFRIFDNYKVTQPPGGDVLYPVPVGGVVPGFVGGGGLLIDPSPIVGFFVEGGYIRHFGPRAGPAQTAVWDFERPAPPTGNESTITLVGGLQFRL